MSCVPFFVCSNSAFGKYLDVRSWLFLRAETFRALQRFSFLRSQASFDLLHIFGCRQSLGPNATFQQSVADCLLFVTCSREIADSLFIPCWRALKIVISVAKSLAFKMIVGAKSARGRLSGTFHWAFIAWVDFQREPGPLCCESTRSHYCHQFARR